MSKEELKQKIHLLIDEIEDEKILNLLYEDALEYKSSVEVKDELSVDQWSELQETMKQVEMGETFSQDQVMQHFTKDPDATEDKPE